MEDVELWTSDPIYWVLESLDLPTTCWGHVPFYFWLVSRIKPGLLIELGTKYDVSYTALCETVLRLRLSTQCYAVDTRLPAPVDDPDGEPIYDDLASFHNRRYSAFSELLREPFDKAKDRFTDGTIDLLHINRKLTYNEARHNFHVWRPKLSDRAVVVIHNTSEQGVGRLFAELRQHTPSFEFTHGRGLGVLATGAQAPKIITELCSLGLNGGLADFRDRFAYFGARLEELAQAKKLSASAAEREQRLRQDIESRDALIVETTSDLARVVEKTDSLTRGIEALEGSLATWTEKAIPRATPVSNLPTNLQKVAEGLHRLEKAHRQAAKRCASLTNASLRQQEDHIRALALLKRPEYTGRLPRKLSGPKLWISGRRGKLRRLARDYHMVTASPLFDGEWYLANNHDIAVANWDPAYHYLRHGASAGIAPGPYFDGHAYQLANPDVLASGENPLVHFIRVGAREGRSIGGGLPPSGARPLTAAAYREWVRLYDTLEPDDVDEIVDHLQRLDYQPLISVIMPVFDPSSASFRKAIDSVRAQLYENWELCIADDASPSPDVGTIIAEYAKIDSRIKWMRRPQNGNISAASNSALEMANGTFIALMDHDDIIPAHALYEVVVELNSHPDANIIYSDEDLIDDKDRRHTPYFKTDWNPELFLQHNMLSHLGVYRRSLATEVGGFRLGFEGSQDYDLALRCIQKTSAEKIRHIPRVLYHWRKTSDQTSFSERNQERCIVAARRAKNGYLASIGDPARIVAHPKTKWWDRVLRPTPNPPPLVTLIVPSRNRVDLLRPCLDGLMNRTSYRPIEIIIVDHDSDEPEALALLEQASADPRVRILHHTGPFNFSIMNNRAVALAKGELVALVNNDTEVITPDWLNEMVALATRPENGAVGAKLLYRDGRVQHAGVGLGLWGAAGHFYDGHDSEAAGHFGRLQLASNVSAVTGACLVVRKSAYLEVGGLNENDLPVAFNDVDLCLKLREKGYRNVWTPFAILYHYGSASRGPAAASEGGERSSREADWMFQRWGDSLTNDPFLSPNFALVASEFALSFPPRRMKPWRALTPAFMEN